MAQLVETSVSDLREVAGSTLFRGTIKHLFLLLFKLYRITHGSVVCRLRDYSNNSRGYLKQFTVTIDHRLLTNLPCGLVRSSHVR